DQRLINAAVANIRRKVERYWIRPRGLSKGLSCELAIRLAPGGQVLSARVARSSGTSAFDGSAKNAVYAASPLPVGEPRLFKYFKNLNLRFKPVY
ncbi:MAG: cell envelope integrity protein TolA, partial [Gammaproteobacteria bacterium]|nr:cell envelope integrity protein TolA [Gammaproteobacteria bacterium]